jgi:hypothetical protein
MSYRLQEATPTVKVSSPTIAGEARFCTILSFPSTSVLVYTIDEQSYQNDRGATLLNIFSDAVEVLLEDSRVVGATGTQGLDKDNLIFDAVTFTVQYVPPYPILGQIIGDVQIPVDSIALDPELQRLLPGGSPLDLIIAEYNRLQALSGG